MPIGTPRLGGIVGAGTATTTLAVPYPASVAVGELLVIAWPMRASSATGTGPSATGWTTLTVHVGNNTRICLLYKIAESADVGAASVTVTSEAVLRTGKMIAVPGVDATTPIDQAHTSHTSTVATNSAVMAAQTPTVAGCMPLWATTGFLGAGVTWTSPDAGAVEALDTWQEVASGDYRSGSCYYQSPLADTASTGTRTATASAEATVSGIFVLLRPATATVVSGSGNATATATGAGSGTAVSDGLGPEPVDLSTQGTVRTANTDALIQSQIDASAAGDTVEVAAGTYGYITVTKSIATGLIRVVPAPGATVTVAGWWFNGAQGIDVRGINSSGQTADDIWFGNNAVRCRWRGGTHTVPATCVAFNVRQGCSDVVIEDVTVKNALTSFNVQHTSETSRPTNVTIQRFRSENVAQDHVFLSRGDNIVVQQFEMFGHTESAEHSDGVQIVGAKDVTIRRGRIWNTRTFRDNAIDRNDHGILVNYDPAETPEGRVPERITVENLLIHDQTSTGIAVAGCRTITIRSCTAYDNGLNGGAAGLVLTPDAGTVVDGVSVHNNVLNSMTVSGSTLVGNSHNFVADGTGGGTGTLTGSPGLDANYKPLSNSVLQGSGSAANAPTVDLYGATRSSPPDRGAVENVAAAVVAGAGDATAGSVGSGAGSRVAVGAGAGSADSTGAGAGSVVRVGSAAGDATSTSTGTGSRVVPATAAATSESLGAGAGVRVVSGAAAATATATGVGAGVAVPTGAGGGTSTSTSTGAGVVVATGTAASTATATGAAIGVAVTTGAGLASGSATGTATGVAVRTGAGEATAASAATAAGATVATGTGSATATSEATGTGGPVGVQTGSGAATAESTAAGTGSRVVTGSGAGTATATSAGAGAPVATGSGAADASFTGAAVGRVVIIGAGSATADSTGTGAGAAVTATVTGSGAATAASTATGAGYVVPTGQALSTAASQAAATGLLVAVGAAAGTASSTATGTGARAVTGTATATAAATATGAGAPGSPYRDITITWGPLAARTLTAGALASRALTAGALGTRTLTAVLEE